MIEETTSGHKYMFVHVTQEIHAARRNMLVVVVITMTAGNPAACRGSRPTKRP
jgi:hypothetical protein